MQTTCQDFCVKSMGFQQETAPVLCIAPNMLAFFGHSGPMNRC
ncbi:hypothetical protein CAter10_4430 [Collimonas arenae]|nr:hypothetical protein CAter10_4430 [Collimonas arenae]